jgi:hypothetical protein
MKRKIILVCCVLGFATLTELSVINWIEPLKDAKITPIYRGVDVDFVSNYTRAYWFTGITIFYTLLILTFTKFRSRLFGPILSWGAGTALAWIIITLIIGCPNSGSPYATISSGLQILYWSGPNPSIPDYQDWMIDCWNKVDENQDPNENVITKIHYTTFEFHCFLKGTDNSIIKETGTKFKAEVVGHWDFSADQWISGGNQDKWEALGYFDSKSSDSKGDAVITVGLGDTEKKKFWEGYTATFVDVKLTCPMAPWTPIYLKCWFIDQYPGDQVSWFDTLYTCGQIAGDTPSGNKLNSLAATSFDPTNITWAATKEIKVPICKSYTIDPNDYSDDPNVSFYSDKWCRMDPNGLQEVSSICPAYPYLPIPTPELMGMDPNMDPNDFPYWDPNSPLYKFVDPSLVDPGYMADYNPYYCTFKYGLPEGMVLPPIHPLSSTTAYLVSKKVDGSYFPITLAIKIYIAYVNYDENYVIGFTSPIIPCLCWLYNDYYWTGGHFDNKTYISLEQYGQLEIKMPCTYGDFNMDKTIDTIDLLMFSQCWLGNVGVYPNNYELSADSNLDGIIDMKDFSNFAGARNNEP